MKVTISVGGKFHAFHLARQLDKNGYLKEVFTSYPWNSLKYDGVPRNKVRCLIFKEALGRAISKIPYFGYHKYEYHLANIFDSQVARRIDPGDIFVGWSGFSLKTMRRIRKHFPAKIILERGSTHIENQRDVLLKEQVKAGIKQTLICPELVAKELEEYQEADYISVPSQVAKDTFLDKGFDESKLIQVPLGVDTGVFKPITKADSKFRIITVGLHLRKGTHYLMQAVAELKIRDLELWLIGKIDPQMKPFLKRYSGSYTYFGGIGQRELYRYYSQGSIFVLFSSEDGFGMALLEAMACARAVICSSLVGAKDVIRDNAEGFVVKAGDVEALKEKIDYLYRHPDICSAMGERALERVKNNFTWDHYGDRIKQVYQNILKTR